MSAHSVAEDVGTMHLSASCPDRARHATIPRDPWEHAAWLLRMRESHISTRCDGCGLDAIWLPREEPGRLTIVREARS